MSTVTLTTPWGTRLRTARSARYLLVVERLDANGTSTGAHIATGSMDLAVLQQRLERTGRGDWTHRRYIMDRLTGEVV
jgi:hypothetical protein